MMEAMMRPTCRVKEELRRIWMKMDLFRHEITEIRVSTFWISEV